MNATTALQQALRLRDQPDRLTDLQRAPLPPEMTALIRIATEEGTATPAEHTAAAAFLQQVCLHTGADARRCLGLRADDDLMTARTHHRLLIRWLHPDRNPDDQLLAERVNSAWTALKNPAPVALTVPEHSLPAQARMRSRFPVFLGVLLAGAMLLLAVSLLPDAPVYVDVAEKPAPAPAASDALPSAVWPAPVIRPELSALASPPVSARTAPAAPAVVPEKKPMAPAVLPKPETKTALNPNAVQIAPKPVSAAPRLPISTPVAAPVFAAAPLPESITAAEAEALLQQFQSHYQSGNMRGMMALFSPKAISLKGGFDAIAADYSRLFTGTRQRRIALSDARWQTVDEARRLRAGFQTELAFAAGQSPQRRSGNLEMLLVRENGKPRILELLMTE